ncbi:winged helix-turn-helix domain-containing protein [Streptomyces sp. NPDC086549]|uniref:helix-turn-helix domain-containing protein n=1 Tax=Streptomyces sp. NPDC086549 TaxID=3365752 RepID=UPI003808F07E
MLDADPAASGWSDQCWTLARIAEIVRRRFSVENTLAGLDLLLHRIGWSVQVPSRRATERDEAKIAAWKDEQWPVIKRGRRTWAPGSASRTKPTRGLRPPKGHVWGRRDRTPVVRVTAAGTKRVSMVALTCTKAGHRPQAHLPYSPRPRPRQGPSQRLQRDRSTPACSMPHTNCSAAPSSWCGPT